MKVILKKIQIHIYDIYVSFFLLCVDEICGGHSD